MSEPERESMEVDVLFVGAGPATLASAYHLMKEVERHNEQAEQKGQPQLEPPTVLVIEKAAGIGDHQLSGACMNPRAIRELIPDFEEQGFPTEHVCDDAQFMAFLPGGLAVKSPVTPPNFQKKGYHVISLSDVVKWMGEKCEEVGVEIYPGFAGAEVLSEGDRVIGVRTGDMGVDKDGKPKPTYQPGMDIIAKVTVFGEGVRGSCTKQLIARFGLEGPNEPTYETGIKEIWRVKPENHKPGRVIHGSEFPRFFSESHGMWLYDMADNLISYGFVTNLASENPNYDPHLNAQKFKTHPFMRKLLEGAELIRYGAKALPTGGLYSQPKLYTNGAMLVGDSANFCNAYRLAGVHMAIKSGMMAAETIIDGMLADDYSAKTLGAYTERYKASWAYEEHLEARNFTGSMEISPLFFMGVNMPAMMLTGGRGVKDPLPTHAGHKAMKKLWDLPPEQREKEEFEFDNVLTFSKEHLVGYSGTAHEADQVPHLHVADTDLCSTTCAREYGNPCENFCPAAVYEMVPDTENPGQKKLFIHHENCVHCKTCDIADPYQIITWTPPEGGEGPDYTKM
jgi:electron-transferring-flavoprotein dehydrogenase